MLYFYVIIYLTIIPRARVAHELIANEALSAELAINSLRRERVSTAQLRKKSIYRTVMKELRIELYTVEEPYCTVKKASGKGLYTV